MVRIMRLLAGLGAGSLAALALTAAACKSRPEPILPKTVLVGPRPTTAPPWDPPAEWSTMGLADFEALVLANLPEDRVTPLRDATLKELARALDAMDETSVRAAVMLGRSQSPDAAEVLLARLQRRVLGPERNSDAGDVVAAAALGRFPRPERYWRIVRMVDGAQPHPDLEVRVECACTALSSGFDRVIPFLLEVLRIGTWIGESDARDFTPPETSAWVRSRAAEALSARAGVPVTYQADASIAEREREIHALEALLVPILAKTAEDTNRALEKR
jgi:hypothetical protein